MNRRAFALLVTCVAAGGAGCVVRSAHPVYYPDPATSGPPEEAEIYVTQPPPPPVAEYRSPPPGPGFVWIEGYWDWSGYDWFWVQGYWMRPHRGYVYVPPSYVVHGNRWRYHRSHWVDRHGRRDYGHGRPHRGRGDGGRWDDQPHATTAPPAGYRPAPTAAQPAYPSGGSRPTPVPARPAGGGWSPAPTPAQPASPSSGGGGNWPAPTAGSPAGAPTPVPSRPAAAQPSGGGWSAPSAAPHTPAPVGARPVPAPSGGWENRPTVVQPRPVPAQPAPVPSQPSGGNTRAPMPVTPVPARPIEGGQPSSPQPLPERSNQRQTTPPTVVPTPAQR